jgi:integrase
MPKRAGRNLTYKFIEGLKPLSKMQTFPDLTEGLELYLTPGGSKTFSFRYRLRDGTRRRVNLGRWPGLKLEVARVQARALANDVAEGRDPLAEKKKELHALRTRQVKTLEELMEALLTASAANLRPSTLAYWTWMNAKHIAPRLKGRLEEITAGAIRAALREIGQEAGYTTANRTFALLRRAFNFGIEEEHITTSPLGRMKALFDEESRSRVLSDAEIRALWAAAESARTSARQGDANRDELAVSRAMACAVQLCLVTLQRGGEVIGMTANELNLEEKTWTLPASRTKAKRDHVVPLSDLAVTLIKEAAEISTQKLGRSPRGADPVFPTSRGADWERDEAGALKHSPKSAVRLSLGRAMARLCEAASVADASAHDLRRTGSTVMASERIGVLSEVVARVLNHAPPGLGVTAIYNRYAYLPEKRSALDRWAAVLRQIVEPNAEAA